VIYLILVSILWSFSFGIIKYGLSGIDSSFISLMRNLIAFLFFASLTLYNFKKFIFDIQLILIGAIQFGLMYVLYIQSYQYLPAYLIATFTITTPIFIGIFSQLLQNKSFSLNGIFSILLVVLGSLMMRFNIVNPLDYWLGFFLIQCANICFAIGQIMFKKWYSKNTSVDIIYNFSQMFFGAVLITSMFSIINSTNIGLLNTYNLFALLFLGLFSTGFGFLTWNLGSIQVSNERLALMNNAVIPIAIFNSYLIFGEAINPLLFAPGLVLFYLAFKIVS
jgi:drug/metabolite transporter (DMT)-like permease|tara:strand:- start:49119 stop:49952 length:834 start_codon:yes stop_codon:yes gene_type:complete